MSYKSYKTNLILSTNSRAMKHQSPTVKALRDKAARWARQHKPLEGMTQGYFLGLCDAAETVADLERKTNQ